MFPWFFSKFNKGGSRGRVYTKIGDPIFEKFRPLETNSGQFQDVYSPDKLSDHDIVSGALKIFIPLIKKPRRKVYLYQKGDYESIGDFFVTYFHSYK